MKRIQNALAASALALGLIAFATPAQAGIGCKTHVYVTNKTGKTLTVRRVKLHRKKEGSFYISIKNKTLKNGQKAKFSAWVSKRSRCEKAKRRIRVKYLCNGGKMREMLSPYKKNKGKRLKWNLEIKSCR